MKLSFFTSRMKMADLIAYNNDLILLLPRFGISLGFGDSSVREVCKAYHVSTDLFLMVCNIYSFDGYMPDEDGVSSIDIHSLVGYLQASHRYYLNERLPHMQRHLNNITAAAPKAVFEVLNKYFSDYRAEVARHFEHEEQSLFPFLKSLGGASPKSLPVECLRSHEQLKDKLSDLTQIIYKYLPGDMLTEELMELVFGILQLSKDLEKHALIEELFLLPKQEYALSEREKDVLFFVVQGLSSKQIADRLNISVHTVNSHRKNITQKTGIKSVAALAVFAALHYNIFDN